MKKLHLSIITAGISLVVFAADYTWTGAADDGGNWTTTANWRLTNGSPASDYPRLSSDTARFSSAATVSVDTGSALAVGVISVSENVGTVTMNGTEGSSLAPDKTAAVDGNCFVVMAGSKLVLNLPVVTSSRLDKWQLGEIVFNSTVTGSAGLNPLIVDNGKATFSGCSVATFAQNYVAVGNYYNGNMATAALEIRDSAIFNAASIRTGINANRSASVGHIVQDGVGSAVNVSGDIVLAATSGHADQSSYELNSGTLVVGGTLTVGSSETARYVQTGGTATVAKVTLANGSVANLLGGMLNVPKLADIVVGSGCRFSLAGGTLALSAELLSSWNWADAPFGFTSGSSVALIGTSSLDAIYGNVSTYDLGLEIGSGKTVKLAADAKVFAPSGSTNAWKVTINDGATLQMNEATVRVAVPLDLAIKGTGRIRMYSGADGFNGGYMGAVVAHRLVVDGVEKSKGRYNGTQSFLLAGTDSSVNNASSIIVPYVWNGAGDGISWSDGANWEGGSVPLSGMPVDISRASSVVLNDDVTVSCLIAMPNRAERKTTVTGSGSVLLSGDDYACGVFVPEGCELVLDVDFKRTSNNTMSMIGGGTLTLKKSIPSSKTDAKPLLSIDGKIVLSGANTLYPYTGSSYNFITHYSANPNVTGEIEIDDGTDMTTARFCEGVVGDLPSSIIIRQRGGTMTYDNFWIQNFSGLTDAGATGYILEGGTLNAPAGVFLGRNKLTSNKVHYPGGDFEMSGGVLNCAGFECGCNQNYVRLYGGVVNLTGDMKTSPIAASSTVSNDTNSITYYLGGVTIRPTTTGYALGNTRSSSDSAASSASCKVCLTGRNGNVKFALDNYAMSFSNGVDVHGSGGLEIVSGSYWMTCRANLYSTGAIIVSGGKGFIYEKGTMNGPVEFRVSNADSQIDIKDTATIGKSPDYIVLAANSCLKLASNQHLVVKRLVVNGVDCPAGTYTFTSGTVTVATRAGSWLDGTSGDLSWESNGTTTTVDAATTLSSLVYHPVTEGQTNELSGALLTFEDGANIHVAKGNVLVINNDVVLDGKVTKTGWGEVVFNGAVSGVTEPTAESDGVDPRWLTVQEGVATFDGTVQGVRLVSCGSLDAGESPVVALKENCTVSNYAIVLTAWNEENAACCGETRQTGATVDYTGGVFSSLRNGGNMYPLSRPRGGNGRYVLDGGIFRSSDSYHVTMLPTATDAGTFEFIQNGGVFTVKDFYFARAFNVASVFTYTLNGGRLEMGGLFSAIASSSRNFINLNGGTYNVGVTGAIRRENFGLSIGGEVIVEIEAGKTLTIADDCTGGFVGSLVKTGAGTLELDGALCLAGLDIQIGTVTIKEQMKEFASGETTLAIARTGATLCLDYEGQMPVKTLKVGGRERLPGVYSVVTGPQVVRSVLTGDGELWVREGKPAGAVISFR